MLHENFKKFLELKAKNGLAAIEAKTNDIDLSHMMMTDEEAFKQIQSGITSGVGEASKKLSKKEKRAAKIAK